MGKELLSNKSYAPLVSIIMPVYNPGRYLREAIRDIFCQTYTKWELICIDDGSTDDSFEILNYYAQKDDRVHVIIQKNTGAAVARNKGLDVAKGDYLLFLDSDDRFESNLLELTVQEALRTKADFVLFNARAFDDKTGNISDKTVILNTNLTPKNVFSFKDVPENIFQISATCAWNKLYKTDFVSREGLHFQHVPYLNDVYFTAMGMVLADKIAVLDTKLVEYRRGRKSQISGMTNKRKKPVVCFEVLDYLQNALQERGIIREVGNSYAKYAYERIISQITETLNEDNYQCLKTHLENDAFNKYGIDRLRKNDFEWGESYEDVRLFYQRGVEALLARLFQRYAMYFLDNFYGTYDDCETNKEYFWDIGRIPKYSKVVLYGAGNRGKEYYNKNKKAQQYEIVLWVDANAGKIKDTQMRICEPSIINCTEFDYIIIAIDNFEIVKSVLKSLKEHFPEKKIIW